MKNIQIIDAADNCAYDLFQCKDGDFIKIFGETNIAFIENLDCNNMKSIFDFLWSNPIEKSKAIGIHGTIFYGLKQKKERFYPNRRESDLNFKGRGWKYID